MGPARSTFYDQPKPQAVDEARLIERIAEICAEWPAYGYRRVTAELHAEGRIVNHKKVMRIMKENGLSVRPRRRLVATTDSDHDGPIFPNLAKNVSPSGPDRLWVTDITYIAVLRLHISRRRSRCLVSPGCRLFAERRTTLDPGSVAFETSFRDSKILTGNEKTDDKQQPQHNTILPAATINHP
jgi:hypothetical protein